MGSQEFWSAWWWPALTAATGFAFTGLVFVQWLKRRKPHQLWWSIGLLLYAVAAVMETVSELTGSWNPLVYRFYIVFAACLVGFLGQGSAYLLIHKRKWIADAYLLYNLAVTAVFLFGTLTATLVMDKLVPGITVGGQALGASGTFPRFMSMFVTIPGTIFLLGGAVISIPRFARKKEYSYRMWANVLIAIGTLVIAWAGSMARTGQAVGLYPAEMVASAILLAGFLMAGTLDKGARAARDAARAKRAAEDAPAAQVDSPEPPA